VSVNYLNAADLGARGWTEVNDSFQHFVSLGSLNVSVRATHLDELADFLPAKDIMVSALDLIIDRAHVYAWCIRVH
jgi:hypothetical protein